MKRFFSRFGESWVAVSGRCELSCFRCPIWEQSREISLGVDKHIYQSIKKKTFKIQSKLVNVTGGDPFLNPFLPKILSEISQQGGSIRLWTHGQVPKDFFETVLPWLAEIVFFISFPESTAYREYTGSDGFESVIENLKWIKKRINTKIAFRVTPENIDWLPEIYEIAYQHQCRLWIVYDPNEAFTGPSLSFIKRYYRVENVSVFKDTFKTSKLCQGFGTGVLSLVQRIKNKILEIWYSWHFSD